MQISYMQSGYSSPAESGIMEDLGLSVAEVSVLRSTKLNFILTHKS